MKKIVAFDFDGTLTTKDTFPLFVKFAVGRARFLKGFLLYSPLLVLMKLGLYPNGKAKQKVFSHFFKGMSHSDFEKLGQDFADRIDNIVNPHALSTLKRHSTDGDKIYVISASIDEWVRPWCMRNGASMVIGTQVEIDANGLLTGRFRSDNCYGKEKVDRLLAIEPDRSGYFLCTYGDSKGDHALLAFADKAYLIGSDGLPKCVDKDLR